MYIFIALFTSSTLFLVLQCGAIHALMPPRAPTRRHTQQWRLPQSQAVITSASCIEIPSNWYIGVARVLKSSSRAILWSSPSDGDNIDVQTEAEKLRARAKAIRDSLPAEAARNIATATQANNPNQTDGKQSTFSLPPTSLSSGYSYRLYIDVGREPGTWMDPRWGASGRRIESTIDISFSKPSIGNEPSSNNLVSKEIADRLAKTVTNKSSKLTPVYQVQCAPYARLRGGFDKMKVNMGGYCIESATRSSTLRFCLSVDGTQTSSGSYGDVSIPDGYLYFALPYFGTRTTNNNEEEENTQMSLSTKEGTVTVKQMGWHTGWWREESRILGVFRAIPLHEAQRRDKF